MDPRKLVEAGSIVPVAIDGPLLHRDIAVLFRDGAALDGPSRDLLRLIEAEGASRSRDPVPQQTEGAAK